MSKAIIIGGVVVAVGVGVVLVMRRKAAAGVALPMTPNPDPAGVPGFAVTGVPERIGDKRLAGTAMASTSDVYRPELPPGAAAVGAAYQRGSDVVEQGKSFVTAAGSGDVAGALGALAGGASSARDLFGGKAATTIAPTSPPKYQFGSSVVTPGAKTVAGVSSVRDTSGNVYSADKYGGTQEFQALRSAADAIERKANIGAGHF